MNLVDTNILVRFFTKDDPEKAERCKELLAKGKEGKIDLFISDMVFAELVWVLEKVYLFHREKIKGCLEAILGTENLRFGNKNVLEETIFLYEKYNIDFIDAYHSAFMRQKGFSSIYSYDTDFDKLSEIERREP